MEEPYDYFQHKYCVSLLFDYNTIISEIRPLNDKDKLPDNNSNEEDISLLFDTFTGTVIARGDTAIQKIMELKLGQEGFFYVPNIFHELNNIYQRSQKSRYKHTSQDLIIRREAINVLQQTVYHWKKQLNSLNMDFYFVFILPTNWDYKTREELIRPLFIEVGLIHGNDDQSRLIFFTELESIFRIMQDKNFSKYPDIKPGIQYVICTVDSKEYVICTEDSKNEVSVNLKLVSARYPSLTSTDRKYVPQLLKEAYFTIPFGPKELRPSIISYLKERRDTILSPGTIDVMLERSTFPVRLNSLKATNCSGGLSYQNFEKRRHYFDEPYNFKEKEIDAMQSITVEHRYMYLYNLVEKVFKDQMNKLFEGTGCIKDRSMKVFHAKELKHSYLKVLDAKELKYSYLKALLESIVKWSKIYNEEQTNFYNSNANKEAHLSRILLLRSGVRQLVDVQIQEFIINRDPIILSKETATVQPENSLKPVFFVNIDMSFTQMKTVMTYFDENRQIQQTENIECNMQPLNSFIIQSKLYQRPVLHITKRLKRCLKEIFGSYLKMYSYSNRRNMTRELLINPASKFLNRVLQKDKTKSTFLGNYFKIKSSNNRPKEIRNLFVTSNPNLFQQLRRNIEMKDLFTSKNEHCSADDDLVTICHPGYIYFFMMAYLYNLNKLLEEKLYGNLGNDWRANNIWYGVSVDKNLLDNVFGSEKKLRKLFFASEILDKDDNLRKAKFCTRGEEILPAIQQKFDYLNFKMKSYFVVAQIFSDRVQLTLHQVVKFASPEEDAATIIIQDEIVYIANVYDVLCKKFMTNMQANGEIDHCVAHKYNQYTLYDFGSFQTYRNFLQNLKPCVEQLLRINEERLDMDSKVKLKINDICDCGIIISLRNMIEIGLKPVMQDIATIIAGSLTNKRLFGNYEIDYLFVLGDPFSLSYGSLMHATYTIITKEAIDDGVHLKEKDTGSFVIRESLSQLMELITHSKPYLYDRFLIGTLCQVSSGTFGIRFLTKDGSYESCFRSFSLRNHNYEVKKTTEGGGTYLVIIQEGKPISKKGLMLTCDADSDNDIDINIIKSRHSNVFVKGGYALLDPDTEGGWYYMYINPQIGSETRLIVECKYVDHIHSLEISVRICDNEANCDQDSRIYVEPLTLAYI